MKARSIFWIFSTTFILAFSGKQTAGSLTTFCEGKGVGNYPDPERCEGYITCVGVNAVKMNCPPGLHYNYQKNYCDWPSNVKCKLKENVPKSDPPQNLNGDTCGTRRKGFMQSRIIGGKKAKEGAWPWQVGIIKKSKDYVIFCGGTLISPNTVLTAAHCIEDVDKPLLYAVRVGDLDLGTIEEDEEVVDVKQLIVHNEFNSSTLENDIAVIVLAKNVNLTEACLPEKDIALKACFVTGWGDGNQILNQAMVPIISKDKCKKVMKAQYKDGMLCAGYITGGIDACQGDSGGPLVCRSRKRPIRFYLKGIVSWGKGCAQNGTYGMYTDVPFYSKWIRKELKKRKLPEK